MFSVDLCAALLAAIIPLCIDLLCVCALSLVVNEYWLYTCYIGLACAENCKLKILAVRTDSVSGYV